MATAEGVAKESGMTGRIQRWFAERRERKYQAQLALVNQSLRFFVPQLRGMVTVFAICHDFRRSVDSALRPESIETTAGFRELKELEKSIGITVGPIEVLSKKTLEKKTPKGKVTDCYKDFQIYIPISIAKR